MRALAYMLIALGIWLLASACYDDYRGSTTKPAMLMGMRHNRAYLYSVLVPREQNPELFHEFMVTHWISAFLVEVQAAFYL